MKIKIYEYPKCTTCQKALQFLDQHQIQYEKINIKENPPSKTEIKAMFNFFKKKELPFKKIFNTSGLQYKDLKISEKLAHGLNEVESIELLAGNGMLIKRPFVLTEEKGLVGFKEELWCEFFNL